MKNIRTDMAAELVERVSEDTLGYAQSERTADGVKICEVLITGEAAARRIGKPCGRYVTMYTPDIKFSNEQYETACRELAGEIKKMLPHESGITLVVGLGNRNITPDALGTEVTEQLMVTHHIKAKADALASGGISSVCAIAPGVMGTTGMETVEIIKGIAERLRPTTIIAVDACASADYSRLGTTIQLSDTGIQPGAGVGNNRKELSEAFLGAKVIAVAAPTVVDSGEAGDEPLMVTPRDIDLVIKRMAKTIAGGINLALHDITLDEAEEYVG